MIVGREVGLSNDDEISCDAWKRVHRRDIRNEDVMVEISQ